MSFITPFGAGKKKLYLINHDPIDQVEQLDEIGAAVSKFLALQTLNEFRDADYNDLLTGELFDREETAKQKLHPDEYYLELIVPADAISHVLPSGHAMINPGFAPKINALKTARQTVYKYDERKGFYQEKSLKLRERVRNVYNYNPNRWPLFTGNSLLHQT